MTDMEKAARAVAMMRAPKGAIYLIAPHQSWSEMLGLIALYDRRDLKVENWLWLKNPAQWDRVRGISAIVVDSACVLKPEIQSALERVRKEVLLQNEQRMACCGAASPPPATKLTMLLGSKDSPSPPLTIWPDGKGQKTAVVFGHDGKLVADWVALRAMKDAFDAGNRDVHVIVGAALWTARNSM